MSVRQWHGGELRWDQETRAWVVLAPGRRTRPHHDTAVDCPFCPGPGEDTPPETWRLPGSPEGTWRIRAVPNRYALSDRHEVVIESPRHDWDLATATDGEVADVLHAWQQRHLALRDGTAQVVVFRNRGSAAGISLTHPHSQVAGLPVLSSATRRELDILEEHYETRRRHLAEETLAGELVTGQRIVYADEHVVAFTPFAPSTDFEVHLVQRKARADFAAVPRAELAPVATALRAVLAALGSELGDPAYNLIVRTAPTGFEDAPFLSWSVRIMPRLAVSAGLELSTGIPVLTTTPEDAARRLRERVPLVPSP